jgi:hypothetical protein
MCTRYPGLTGIRFLAWRVEHSAVGAPYVQPGRCAVGETVADRWTAETRVAMSTPTASSIAGSTGPLTTVGGGAFWSH